MEKIQDKIYDVYYSETDTNFRRKVRERIHWICRNISGDEVLDIGCSQGITAILLGREGKKVLGLDLSEDAIREANENLEKEEEETRNSVRFEKGNLVLKEFEQQYSSVILGEVLEHINDIESFFTKASSLVKENGRLIITTPFGINDFVDHKRTFYLNDFLKLQTSEISIAEVKFFGKWIGVIYQKGQENKNDLLSERKLFDELEEAFNNIERSLLTNQQKLNKKVKMLENKTKNSEEQINALMEKKIQLEKDNQLLIENTKANKNDYQKKYLDEKVEKVKIQKQLLDEYKREEKLLSEKKEMTKEIEKIENRYSSLKNSKLGKLTTRYWKLRNKKGR
ncbi:class I SAM-dependent methyltransferase [Oceanobacillus arenosus]|uniref:class I SAM-dependent methyltransferase n=1 Tax=Oceanobacillus arenosus TaxID=1229153 RepID=UPI001475281F|nr:methyltransferase domain-containing protein [Oceanobacillus arenosus]